jgi:DHA3 family macrolide efflux protein-like MFS transporter
MIASIVMPMAMLLFGPLSDVIKIEWLLLITGSLILVQGNFMVKNKVLLEAGRNNL